ncbi:uncharacterized protein LOC117583747 [Drosophila guanche]|uniref:uncharacterized protein LOC117583747 n=1 Tax=Drosophila guanche TaxID=7266 RepID=UPI0014711698|nr:uncharacterized protein LOC117583747 [Drosophila guanche]
MAPKTREAQLAEMDLIFLEDVLPKCHKCLTTTQTDYVNHHRGGRPLRCKKIAQEDPSLLSGHYANNLKVNGQEMKTKSWPLSMDWREEYEQFVRRNKWCNEEIYKLFFLSPPVQYKQIEQYLKDLQKTVYMFDYSPKEYVSLLSQRRRNQDKEELERDSKHKDYWTTYGNYYNRVQETEQFRDAIYAEPKPKDFSVENFAKVMRKLFTKYNLTTYFDDICVPALFMAKNGIMPSGPIDCYTQRKY